VKPLGVASVSVYVCKGVAGLTQSVQKISNQ